MRKLSELARYVVLPERIVSTGWSAVRDKCLELGVRFDPWQDGLGRAILAKRADGKYAAGVGGVVVSIPRQVGKTYTVGAIVFALCILFPGLTVIWTAHRLKTAGETFQSMQGMARRSKVAPHVAQIFTGSGDEEIRFRNGSRILFGARERGFGRGFAEVDIEVFDEAQILTDRALDDMVPAANQSKQAAGALLFFIGTPPKPTDPGEAFTAKRAKALAGKTTDTLYVEFSADKGADPDDRKQWRKANPSYPRRTPEEAMLRMRENLSEDSFPREAMGIWDEVEDVRRAIPPDVWEALAADDPPAQDVPPTALAVDMSHDRAIAIAGCWRDEDAFYVELLAFDQQQDTLAAVEWLAERAGRRIPVVIDSMSPAASMIPTLKLRKVKVIVGNAGDMGKACGGFYDDATAGRLRHGDQAQLNDALTGAKKRPIGQAGGWGWDRKDPESNISPLVAATLARFGASVTKKPGNGRQGGGRRAVMLS